MFKSTVRLLALLLLCSFSCASQVQRRSVTGCVTDKRGNALPRAVVQLKNTATLSIRSFITGKDGRYRFNRLAFDVDYTVNARYGNYSSKARILNKFDSSKHPEVDLVVPIE